jgi:lysophospholipase L1-like esterase
MSFASEQPLIFDMIEIEAIGQPGGGSIDVKLDGNAATHYDLAATRIEPVVIRLLPEHGATDKLHEISITTAGPGLVSLASVSIYNNRGGVTYNSVGYVGAQASLLNKMSEKLFADDLVRINPQIVVLSFGTNEASNEHLDIAQYTKGYERLLGKIKATLPAAALVLIGPPDFDELPASCPKDKVAEAVCRPASTATGVAANAPASPTTALASVPDCAWHTPAKLAQVRDAQRDIAKRRGLVYWNWASIMPGECGAHQWFSASPPLMSRDHVHFTAEGYKKSAEQFLNTLIPVIEKVRVGANAVPNN